MSTSPLQTADTVLAQAAITDRLEGPIRVAHLIHERPSLIAALVRLRDYHSGHVTATAKIIELAIRLESICASTHDKLVAGVQDDWKTELPPGKDKEFRQCLRALVREITRLERG